MVISLGSVGLPGQVSFMATNMPVTQAMGLPIEPLGLLLAVDTIPDVFATVGNVTGDLTATAWWPRARASRRRKRLPPRKADAPLQEPACWRPPRPPRRRRSPASWLLQYEGQPDSGAFMRKCSQLMAP